MRRSPEAFFVVLAVCLLVFSVCLINELSKVLMMNDLKLVIQPI